MKGWTRGGVGGSLSETLAGWRLGTCHMHERLDPGRGVRSLLETLARWCCRKGLLVLLLPPPVSLFLLQSRRLEKADGRDVSQWHSIDGALCGLGSRISIHMQVAHWAQVRKRGSEKPRLFSCMGKDALVQGSRESRGSEMAFPEKNAVVGKGILPLSTF